MIYERFRNFSKITFTTVTTTTATTSITQYTFIVLSKIIAIFYSDERK